MNIAIIGSGNVGKALAKSSVRAGHKVTMTATSAEKAAEAAKATGAHAAKSNQEAVAEADLVIARETIDLILLDVHLPDINGFDVLERLRIDAVTAVIPIVVLSADATPGQVKRFRDAGANEYLTKPLDLKLLLTLIDNYLGDDDSSGEAPVESK